MGGGVFRDWMCGFECKVSPVNAVNKRGVGVGGVTPSAHASSRLAHEWRASVYTHYAHHATPHTRLIHTHTRHAYTPCT